MTKTFKEITLGCTTQYYITLSIVFLLVQKRQKRSLNTIVSGARKTGFYYFFIQRATEQEKALPNLEN